MPDRGQSNSEAYRASNEYRYIRWLGRIRSNRVKPLLAVLVTALLLHLFALRVLYQDRCPPSARLLERENIQMLNREAGGGEDEEVKEVKGGSFWRFDGLEGFDLTVSFGRSSNDSAPSTGELFSTGVPANWSDASEGKRTLFTYSAYLDRRIPKKPCIRVLAFIKRGVTMHIECTYWTKSMDFRTATADKLEIRERPFAKFVPYFLTCPINYVEDPFDPIERVTIWIDEGKSNNYTASVAVNDINKRIKIGELNVCVKLLFSRYNNAIRIVEFIEMYRLLAAEKFTFYDNSVGPDVTRVLNHYVKEGVAEIVPWRPPLDWKTELFYYGEKASTNDCSLRSIKRFPLTLMADVDEYILPRHHETLVELVNNLGNYSDHVFRNTLFLTSWRDEPPLHPNEFSAQERILISRLITQRKLRRLKPFKPFKFQAKYIMRSECVIVAGSHNVWQFTDGRMEDLNRTLEVPEYKAVSHHYRSCPKDKGKCRKKNSLIDRTAHRYTKRLITAVAAACNKIFPELLSCPPL